MADVADDRVVLHLVHVLDGDDVVVTGGRHEDVDVADDIVDCRDLVSLHRGLQGVDRVDLGDDDTATLTLERLRATLAHVAVAGHDGHLAGEHHVGGAADRVDQRVTAAVQVVELALGDRVVDVDRWEEQLPALVHLVETHHAGGGLLGHTLDRLGHRGPLGRLGLQRTLQQAEHDRELGVRCRHRIRHFAGCLELDTLVQQQRGVAAVVENHVRAARRAISIRRPRHHLIGAPPVLLQRLALPGEHRDALRILRRALGADRHGSCRVILRREDVAAGPTHLGAELDQRLDQDGSLDGHVQRAADAGAGERLQRAVLLAQCAQPGHLVLGEMDLLTTEGRKREVGNAKIMVSERGHGSSSKNE